MNVNVWGKLGESCSRVLRKGMRVRIEGSLVQHEWKDSKTDEPRDRIDLVADDVTQDLYAVESVILTSREK